MSDSLSIKQCFEEVLAASQLSVESFALSKLIEYQSLLSKWNKSINLTAHRGERDSIEKNFLDSIHVSIFIQGQSVLDFGTGAGFPGLVLAILQKQRKFFLLEADQKKVSFLKFVVTALALQNVELIHRYAELETPREYFPPHLDNIVSRATISPEKLMCFAKKNLESHKHLLMMLSEKQISSFEFDDNCFDLEKREDYHLPWSKIPHSILILRKK